MRKTLAVLAPLFRPSARRIAVRAIADESFERGRAAGDAEGYERGRAAGWAERDALLSVVRQGVAPSREAART